MQHRRIHQCILHSGTSGPHTRSNLPLHTDCRWSIRHTAAARYWSGARAYHQSINHYFPSVLSLDDAVSFWDDAAIRIQIIHNAVMSVLLRAASGVCTPDAPSHKVRTGRCVDCSSCSLYTGSRQYVSRKGHRETERVKVHPCTTGRSPRWSAERGWWFTEALAATPRTSISAAETEMRPHRLASEASMRRTFVQGAARRGFDIQRQHRRGPSWLRSKTQHSPQRNNSRAPQVAFTMKTVTEELKRHHIALRVHYFAKAQNAA